MLGVRGSVLFCQEERWNKSFNTIRDKDDTKRGQGCGHLQPFLIYTALFALACIKTRWTLKEEKVGCYFSLKGN